MKIGREDIIKKLLKKGANPNPARSNEWIPLTMSIETGREEVARKLLLKGADPNLVRSDGWTPLTMAIETRREDIAKKILKNDKTDVNQPGHNEKYPLTMAMEKGQEAVAKKLLLKGANPNQVDQVTGWTPLTMAIEEEREDIVKKLLKKRADPNLTRSDGCAPIVIAICNNNTKFTKLLINKADLHTTTWQGKTIEELIRENITNECQQRKLLETVRKRRKEETLPAADEVSKAEQFQLSRQSRYARAVSPH